MFVTGSGVSGRTCGHRGARLWQRVQELIVRREVSDVQTRNKHLALLSGLLYCDCCATPMTYSYTGKNDRKYPYYVCLNAQRRRLGGVREQVPSARVIEESVLARLRGEQQDVPDDAVWEQMDREQQIETLQAIVERVGYDGKAQRISIRFHPAGDAAGHVVRP